MACGGGYDPRAGGHARQWRARRIYRIGPRSGHKALRYSHNIVILVYESVIVLQEALVFGQELVVIIGLILTYRLCKGGVVRLYPDFCQQGCIPAR